MSGLKKDNSDLHELAQQAQQEAEKFDQTNAVSELIRTIDDWRSRVDTWFVYVALIAAISGGGVTAVGAIHLKKSVFRLPFEIVGSLITVSSLLIYLIYRVVRHQLLTNAELVAKFNQELTEKPGDVRRHDQDWHMLVAQFMWNRSLLSPKTHITLILLSLIRTLSTSLYGLISAELRTEIKRFVGMSAGEIIRSQVRRLIEGDVPRYPEDEF